MKPIHPSRMRRTRRTEKPGKFADFLLHAPEKKKENVLRAVAHKANKEQKGLYLKLRLKTKTG